jgi:HD-like signal output (HDOD) protein
VSRLLHLIEEENTPISELIVLLEADAFLGERMLKIVNSPIFGRLRAVTGTREAVVILGRRMVCSLALIAKFATYLDHDLHAYGYEPLGLWRHSIAVAATARSIAIKLRLPMRTSERIYTAALLHDIGKVPMNESIQQLGLSLDLARTPDEAPGIVALEQASLRFTHAAAGRLMATHWSLGRLIETVLLHHHQPGRAPEFRTETAVVHVADYLVSTLGVGSREHVPVGTPPDPAAFTILDCKPNFLSDFEARALLEVGTSLVLIDSM